MLKGKTALVTGAERGIGKGVALALAKNGADIAVHYFLSESDAAAVQKEIHAMGRKSVLGYADLTKTDDIAPLFSAIGGELGAIDILVNNVGAVVKRIPFVETDDAFWECVFAVNIMSTVRCSRAVLPAMMEKKWGRIINISSVGSKTGGAPKSVHYATMKGGINSFTMALTKEVAAFGVTVNAIAPGVVETPLLKDTPSWSEEDIRRMYPVGRIGKVDDVAPLAAFLASDDASYITGETFVVAGGR